MPRAPRVHLEGAVYYVTLEGPSQEELFWDSKDYQKYVELLAKYKEEFKFKLFSYALLPHRLHLLIEAADEHSISQIMQKITPLYTKYYNGRYQRKGPLFQKRFRSVVAEKEVYLPQLSRYVHLTPVESGLVQNPADYPHSSYRAFLTPSTSNRSEIASTLPGAAKQSLSLEEEIKEVLSTLPNPQQQDAYERYGLSADRVELELFGRRLSRGAFLGSDEFGARIKERMKDQSKKNHDAIEVGAGLKPAPTFQVGRRLVALSGLLVFAITLSAFSVVYNYQTAAKNLVPPIAIKSGDVAPEGLGSPVRTGSKTDLNGTIWEVELVSEEADGKMKSIRDKIKFNGKSFESRYFMSQGFTNSNYTVKVNDNGEITWETIQKNQKGELVSWHGDWRGNRMEGVMSYRPTENPPQDFQFISQNAGVQK